MSETPQINQVPQADSTQPIPTPSQKESIQNMVSANLKQREEQNTITDQQTEIKSTPELPKPKVYNSFGEYLDTRFSGRTDINTLDEYKINSSLSQMGYEAFLPIKNNEVTFNAFHHDGKNYILVITKNTQKETCQYSVIELTSEEKQELDPQKIPVKGVVVQNNEGQCTDLLEIVPVTTNVFYEPNEFRPGIKNTDEPLSQGAERHPREIYIPPIGTTKNPI